MNSPQDIDYEEYQTGHSIVWLPSDLHPASYMVLLNNGVFLSGPWNTTGESIGVSVDGLSPGVYNYTIILADIGECNFVYTVIVTVAPSGTTTTITTTTTSTTTTSTTTDTSTTTMTSTPPPGDIPMMVIIIVGGAGIVVVVIVIVIGFRQRQYTS